MKIPRSSSFGYQNRSGACPIR